jgi:hypothetical protein
VYYPNEFFEQFIPVLCFDQDPELFVPKGHYIFNNPFDARSKMLSLVFSGECEPQGSFEMIDLETPDTG